MLKALRVSDGAVLVGGQALAFWVAYLGVEIRDAPRAYISGDADFLGMRVHVERFSKAIDGRAEYPSKRDMTAIVGAVEKKVDDMKVGVDVLHRIVGIDADSVSRRAIDVIHPKDEKLRFRVMDPVDCLVSRLENLRQLVEKRNEIGIWQGKLSIDVCRAYVQQLIDLDDERKAIRVATAIYRLAGSPAGLQAYSKYRLDVLEAVRVDRFSNESFRRGQARRSIASIRKARGEPSEVRR